MSYKNRFKKGDVFYCPHCSVYLVLLSDYFDGLFDCSFFSFVGDDAGDVYISFEAFGFVNIHNLFSNYTPCKWADDDFRRIMVNDYFFS